MHFSSAYTRLQIASLERRGVAGRAYRATLTLNLAVEVNLDHLDNGRILQLVIDALNRHAGGQRTLRGQSCMVQWQYHAVDRAQVETGRALGISLVHERIMTAPGRTTTGTPVDGMFVRSFPGGSRAVNRILLIGELAAQLLRQPRAPAVAVRTRFTNSAAHEVGHSFDLHHRSGTLMDDTNDNRIDRRMDDEQLFQLLNTLLTDPFGQAASVAAVH